VSGHAAVASAAVIAYVALFAIPAFGCGLLAAPDCDQPVIEPGLVFIVGLNVGVGLLVGRWWAVLLPALPAAMPFLPGAPEPYEGPFVELAVAFAAMMGVLVAIGVGARKVAGRVLA
jgi:hypothetical protein